MKTIEASGEALRRMPWRQFVQWSFLAWCLFLGIQFGLFVRHFETFGNTPEYLRPPGVEAFLPIGALVSLKHWLVNGVFDQIHPASLVLLLTFFGLALLSKKSFCSWICPVGTIEEALWKSGRKLFRRNFRIWPWLDTLLRSFKYLLLLFFVKLILVDMPGPALQGFLNSPYWAVADIRMLHFFTAMSMTVLVVICILAVLSLFLPNAWCRYLCPYGALLGLLSCVSPLKIRRQETICTSCGSCTRACPSRIRVHTRQTVSSPECTACLTCVSRCPEPGALGMHLPFLAPPLPAWGFGLVVLLLFSGGVATGMLTDHWHSILTYQDFQRLIPMAGRFGH